MDIILLIFSEEYFDKSTSELFDDCEVFSEVLSKEEGITEFEEVVEEFPENEEINCWIEFSEDTLFEDGPDTFKREAGIPDDESI